MSEKIVVTIYNYPNTGTRDITDPRWWSWNVTDEGRLDIYDGHCDDDDDDCMASFAPGAWFSVQSVDETPAPPPSKVITFDPRATFNETQSSCTVPNCNCDGVY